jgi:hypothetical protein
MYWRSVSDYRFCSWHCYASFSVKYTEWTHSGGIATIGEFSFQNDSTNIDEPWCSVSACRTGSKVYLPRRSQGFPPVAPPRSTLSRHFEVRMSYCSYKRSNNEMRDTKRSQNRQWGRSQLKNWVLLSLKNISIDWAIVAFLLTWLCDCCPIGGAKPKPSHWLNN